MRTAAGTSAPPAPSRRHGRDSSVPSRGSVPPPGRAAPAHRRPAGARETGRRPQPTGPRRPEQRGRAVLCASIRGDRRRSRPPRSARPPGCPAPAGPAQMSPLNSPPAPVRPGPAARPAHPRIACATTFQIRTQVDRLSVSSISYSRYGLGLGQGIQTRMTAMVRPVGLVGLVAIWVPSSVLTRPRSAGRWSKITRWPVGRSRHARPGRPERASHRPLSCQITRH
ncbi:hypothetical protein FAIPA1_100028 [Frankia sp. AiPs1]